VHSVPALKDISLKRANHIEFYIPNDNVVLNPPFECEGITLCLPDENLPKCMTFDYWRKDISYRDLVKKNAKS
jgi:hypothetical protein